MRNHKANQQLITKTKIKLFFVFLGETKSFPLTGRLFLPRRRRRRGRPLDVLPADELQVVQQRPLEAEAGRAGLVGAGERLQGAVAGVAVGVATANTFPHDYLNF